MPLPPWKPGNRYGNSKVCDAPKVERRRLQVGRRRPVGEFVGVRWCLARHPATDGVRRAREVHVRDGCGEGFAEVRVGARRVLLHRFGCVGTEEKLHRPHVAGLVHRCSRFNLGKGGEERCFITGDADGQCVDAIELPGTQSLAVVHGQHIPVDDHLGREVRGLLGEHGARRQGPQARRDVTRFASDRLRETRAHLLCYRQR